MSTYVQEAYGTAHVDLFFRSIAPESAAYLLDYMRAPQFMDLMRGYMEYENALILGLADVDHGGNPENLIAAARNRLIVQSFIKGLLLQAELYAEEKHPIQRRKEEEAEFSFE